MSKIIMFIFCIVSVNAGENQDISFTYGILSQLKSNPDSTVILSDSSVIHTGDRVRINIGYPRDSDFLLIFKDSQKGNLSKTPTFSEYLRNKVGKKARVIQSQVERYSDFNYSKYLQEQKLSLTNSLVEQSNKNLKFNGKTRDLIIEKIFENYNFEFEYF